MDNVNHPEHYTSGGIECIDAIRASLGDKEFAGYCKGNIIKYLWRYRLKNGVEDLHKAQVYLGWMIEAEERVEHPAPTPEKEAKTPAPAPEKRAESPAATPKDRWEEGLWELARLCVCSWCELPKGLCLHDNCEEINGWVNNVKEALGHAHD